MSVEGDANVFVSKGLQQAYDAIMHRVNHLGQGCTSERNDDESMLEIGGHMVCARRAPTGHAIIIGRDKSDTVYNYVGFGQFRSASGEVVTDFRAVVDREILALAEELRR